jgi:hypothetical protein
VRDGGSGGCLEEESGEKSGLLRASRYVDEDAFDPRPERMALATDARCSSETRTRSTWMTRNGSVVTLRPITRPE